MIRTKIKGHNVWAAFLEAAVAIGRREHFSISILTLSLSRRSQWLLDVLGVVLVIVFCFLMVWFGAALLDYDISYIISMEYRKSGSLAVLGTTSAAGPCRCG